MRMIDADELYRRVCEEGWYDNDDREQVLDLIDSMNEAVVRCRDCKYCTEPIGCWYMHKVEDNGFCYRGERIADRLY
jgi:hypothetical protein